jgi:hypothetical protein
MPALGQGRPSRLIPIFLAHELTNIEHGEFSKTLRLASLRGCRVSRFGSPSYPVMTKANETFQKGKQKLVQVTCQTAAYNV